MKQKEGLAEGRFSTFEAFISCGRDQCTQSKGEKARGHKTILFSFTVRDHVNTICPTLHASLVHNFKLLEEEPLL